MSETQAPDRQKPLQLGTFQSSNWKVDAAPVAVMNEETTQHERIAYCYAMTIHVCALAEIMMTSSDGDLQRYGELISAFSSPLERVLDRVGCDSFKSEKAVQHG